MKDFFKVVKDRVRTNRKVGGKKLDMPSGLLFKCPRCQISFFKEEFNAFGDVCPNCSYHARITAKKRLQITADKDSFLEYDGNMTSKNPIDFPGYDEKLKNAVESTGINEAIVTGECRIKGEACVLGIMDSYFMMASMGSVVGEKITRAFERATEKNLPVIIFTASGGARMQEGIISLMQMAKTSAAVLKHSEKGLFYCAVLTDPTTGGVTASFASLADITLAEPKVLVGFAGRRVIENTIKQRLSDEFQSAEFLQQHGFVDRIVERKNMRQELYSLIRLNKKRDVFYNLKT